MLGRLVAEFAKGLLIAAALLLLSLLFGIRVASGLPGLVLIVLLTAVWAVVYVGFIQLIALRTRSAAATSATC